VYAAQPVPATVFADEKSLSNQIIGGGFSIRSDRDLLAGITAFQILDVQASTKPSVFLIFPAHFLGRPDFTDPWHIFSNRQGGSRIKLMDELTTRSTPREVDKETRLPATKFEVE